MHKVIDNSLPDFDDASTLANEFADFFVEKNRKNQCIIHTTIF